ncbi:GNAT family N-acetyltransferase [Kitasatospora sp. NPDC058162]|uniref:GNAT family N-acetyltransferase n=1 Tax=Kitasatospora sp. NPDC058162 TaxID=3346362 RepID=UPI0036D878C1
MAGALRVRVVRSAEELNPGLDALVSASGAPFYFGREFLAAYERYPVQAVADRYYLEAYGDGEELLGFAPCHVQADPLGALGLAEGEKALVSNLWHCPDSHLVAVERRPEVAAALLEAMGRCAAEAGLARYGFVNVELGSPSAAALEAAGLTGTPIDKRYALDLSTFATEDEYLATLSGSTRHEYRRQLRRAAEAGAEMSMRTATADEEVERYRLLEISAARFGSAGYYDAQRIVDFLGMMQKAARVNEIRLDGELLAIGILFAEERKLHTWAAGYDRERELPFSPYYLLHASAVRYALELGLPVLEGGRRNDDFKMRFGMAQKPLAAYLGS